MLDTQIYPQTSPTEGHRLRANRILLSFMFMSMAAIQLAFASRALVVVAMSIVGGFIGAFELLRLFGPRTQLKFCHVLNITLLLGYSLGGAWYFLSNIRELVNAPNTFYLPFTTGIGSVGVALAAVFMVSGVLTLAEFFERPLEVPVGFDERIMLRVALVTLLVELGAFLHGDLGFQGTFAYVATKQELSAFGAVGSLLGPLVPPVAAMCFATAANKWSRRFSAVLTIVGLMLLAVQGRKIIMYSGVLTMMAYSWVVSHGLRSGLRDAPVRLNARRLALFLAFGGVALYVVFKLFFALRTASIRIGVDRSLLELLSYAISTMADSSSSADDVDFNQNIAERPFIIGYLADLIQSSAGHSYLHGEELLNGFWVSIPGVFFPNKSILVPLQAEEIIHPHFGMPVFDGPNSILTSGFDDFGVIGLFAYPLGLVVLYRASYHVVKRLVPANLAIYFLISLIYQMLNVEAGIGNHFVVIRNSLLACAGLWMFSKIPVLRFARRQSTSHVHIHR